MISGHDRSCRSKSYNFGSGDAILLLTEDAWNILKKSGLLERNVASLNQDTRKVLRSLLINNIKIDFPMFNIRLALP